MCVGYEVQCCEGLSIMVRLGFGLKGARVAHGGPIAPGYSLLLHPQKKRKSKPPHQSHLDIEISLQYEEITLTED